MNYRMICQSIGRVLAIEAVLLLLPLICALAYGEPIQGFLITMIITALVAVGLLCVKAKDSMILAKEGFISVSLSWILLSCFGALPFLLHGVFPTYLEALFETVSGFTTTGATLLADVEIVARSIIFWRSLTQWIGGMGVLVFVMAVLPLSEDRSLYIMRAEIPGPTVSKILPKMRNTAMLLYIIYISLTVVEVIFLMAGGLSFFDALIHSFGTASTGGFSSHNLSIAAFNSLYVENVIAIFMLLFGINFHLFYFMLIGSFRQIWKNEELLTYAALILVGAISVGLSISADFGSTAASLHSSFFHVVSIITTTGYSLTDFSLWPQYAISVLLLLSILGACSYSTSGGVKISRLLILLKAIRQEVPRLLYPRSVNPVMLNDKPLEQGVITSTFAFCSLYFVISLLGTLLLSLTGTDLTTNLSAVVACLSNVGVGMGEIGPYMNYAFFPGAAKILLMLCMLIGRLEIFPIIMLFAVPFGKK